MISISYIFLSLLVLQPTTENDRGWTVQDVVASACQDPWRFSPPTGPESRVKDVLYRALSSLPKQCPVEGYFAIADALYPHLSQEWEREWLSRELMLRVRVLPLDFQWPRPSITRFRILARRVVEARLAGRRPSGALLREFTELQHRLGLASPYPDTVPWNVVALLPLTGKYAPLGSQILYGLLAANPQGMELTVVDTRSSPAEALRRAVEIVLSRRPIAVIGPPDAPSVRALAAQPWSRPMIFPTAPVDGLPQDTGALFFSRPAPSRRVEALLSEAVRQGATTLCILYPSNRYGMRMAEAMRGAAGALGVKVVYDASYDRTRLPVKFRIPRRCEAVFVPESGQGLERVARRIAAGGIFPGPLVRRNGQVEGLIILSTAEGLVPENIERSYRYLQGALVAPGFFAQEDVLTPAQRLFLRTLRAQGIRRVVVPAYEAYSVYLMLHSLVAAGHRTAQEMLQALQSTPVAPGGPPMFDYRGRSLRPIRVFRIMGQGVEVMGR